MTWIYITDFIQTAAIIGLVVGTLISLRRHQIERQQLRQATNEATLALAEANRQNQILLRERQLLANALQASETENHHYRFFWQQMEYEDPNHTQSKLEQETKRRLHLMMGIEVDGDNA